MTGLRKTEPIFVLRAIRWPHPRFDAIERGFWVRRPRHDRRPTSRDRFFADFDGDVFFAGFRAEGEGGGF